MVLSINCHNTITDVSEGHLFNLISIELNLTTHEVLGRDGEWWVDAIGGELTDALLRANLWGFFTIDSADSEHFLLLKTKLLILALVHLRVLFCYSIQIARLEIEKKGQC